MEISEQVQLLVLQQGQLCFSCKAILPDDQLHLFSVSKPDHNDMLHLLCPECSDEQEVELDEHEKDVDLNEREQVDLDDPNLDDGLVDDYVHSNDGEYKEGHELKDDSSFEETDESKPEPEKPKKRGRPKKDPVPDPDYDQETGEYIGPA